MNAEDATLDMAGIDPRFLRDVPDGAQERLASIDPDLRFVWNNKIKKFQVVYREPGLECLFYDGQFLHNWGLVATFDAPLDVQLACDQMGLRKQFAAEKLKSMGFGSMEEYLDAVDQVLSDEDDPNSPMVDRKTRDLVSDQLDDFCAQYVPGVTKVGPYGEFGSSFKLVETAHKKRMDATSRAHSGKFRPTLLLPVPKKRPALIVPNDFVKTGAVE